MSYPSRIVCLTEETTETLYLLGEGDRVVGVSGYTVRPPEARQKPKVSAFLNARFDKIDALKPDLVLAFSDLQADIARELIRRGYPVYTFNQRSVADILQMIRIVGALVGRAEAGDALAAKLQRGLDEIKRQTGVGDTSGASATPPRPRVFFEEWDDPLISGIQWVEELIEIAGGQPVFPELREQPLAKDRIVDPAEVIKRNPDVIIASWCGKKMQPDFIRSRSGWNEISAIKNNRIYEIKSAYILQPGPAALTEGLSQLRHYIGATAKGIPAR